VAILANKLGASNVLAIDYDEWSITNTIENIEQNASSNIRVAQLSTLPSDEKFDIILANINLNVILMSLKEIVSSSISGTYVLLSGFLLENENVITSSLAEAGLQYISTSQRGDWILVFAKMP
jgi:ribosomal protein L11 methyltransferase